MNKNLLTHRTYLCYNLSENEQRRSWALLMDAFCRIRQFIKYVSNDVKTHLRKTDLLKCEAIENEK